MRTDWTSLAGATLNSRYGLRDWIGEHSEIVVFSAVDTAASDPVQVQLLDSSSQGASELLQLWSTLAELHHPGLLQTLEAGETDIDGTEYVYAVSEQPEEGVSDVLSERALTPEETLQILRAVVPALRYLHEAGFVHSSVSPASIVAVGETVRLTTGTVRSGDAPARHSDVRALGATVVELLTQRQPQPYAPPTEDSLPSPLKEIAGGCLEPSPMQQWTLAQVEQVLAGGPIPSASTPVKLPRERVVSEDTGDGRGGLKRPGILAIGAAVFVLFAAGLMFLRPSRNQPPVAPVKVAEPERVPPVTAPVQPAPPRQAAAPSAVRRVQPGWAVVGAIYGSHASASRRARNFANKWKPTTVTVFPEEGKGQRYMVLLGSGLSRDAAEKLRRRAVSAGLPRDTYVTRLQVP